MYTHADLSNICIFVGLPLVSKHWSFCYLQAQSSLQESSQKIDLLRLSLETKSNEIRGDSRKSRELKEELEHSSTPTIPPHPLSPVSYTALEPKPPPRGSTLGLSKCAAVTGKLEVRLMGCQDLLEDVPGRTKSKESGGQADLKSFVKGVTGRSSSKSYSIKDETSSKCPKEPCNHLPISYLLTKLIMLRVAEGLGHDGLPRLAFLLSWRR
jgi:hypothetical protein